MNLISEVKAKVAKFLNIWEQIKFWKPTWRQIVAFILFLAFFGYIYQSMEMSVIFLLSMYFHEWLHAKTYGTFKINNRVYILFPLGMVTAPVNEEENAVSDKLPWFDVGWIFQAGLLGNMILIVLGRLLQGMENLTLSNWGHLLIVSNVYLALFNLLPIGNLDAGQLFKVIFASLDETRDQIVAWIMAIAGGLLIALLVYSTGNPWLLLIKLVTNLGVIGFTLITAIGILRKSVKDDPAHSSSAQAMSWKQALIHILVFVGMCAWTLIALAKWM